MTKRILVVGIALLAMAMVAPAIGLGGISVAGGVAQAQDQSGSPDDTSGDDSGGDAEDGPCSGEARASGDSCPPPAAQPQQPEQSQQPDQAVQPAPEQKSKKEHKASGLGGESAGRAPKQPTTEVVQATPVVAQGVDTGTIPTGGIQAGAGGTATDGSNAGLLGGTALMLVALAGGGFALRRRHDLPS